MEPNSSFPTYEFDCPQYYDFLNQTEGSPSIRYFETAHDVTPGQAFFSPSEGSKSLAYDTAQESTLGSVFFSPSEGPKLAKQDVTIEDASSVHSTEDGPYKNTRLAKGETRSSSSRRCFPLTTKPNNFEFHCKVEVPSPKKPKVELQPPRVALKKFEGKYKNKPVRPISGKVNRENVAPPTNHEGSYRKRRSLSESSSNRTVPEPFTFETDKRLKSHPIQKPGSNCYKAVDFVATLRSNRTTQIKCAPGPVKALPERLLRGKRKYEDSKTMAEKVLSFQDCLANRVRTEVPPAETSWHVTHPISPCFRAATRSRPVTAISQEQKEILEAEEMKKYHFKAQPIPSTILVPFEVKPRESAQKPKPVPITLETEKRSMRIAKRTPVKTPDEPSVFKFHARPVPLEILQRVTGLRERIHIKPTEAHTPPFALAMREETWKQQEEAKQQKLAAAEAAAKKPKVIRVRARSHDSTMTAAPKEDLKRKLPQPFSFHDRDQAMLAKKEEKVQKVFEQEQMLRKFKANPMPSPAVSGIPSAKKPSTTKCQSFSFEVKERASRKASKFEAYVNEELKQQKAALIFKAQPCTVTQIQPFLPAKSQKPNTEFMEFQLNTVYRAAKREEFDEFQREQEQEKQSCLAAREQERKEAEEKEIAEWRAKAVHKANPVPEYTPFVVKHNLIPVTKAISPKFETDNRLRSKKIEK